MVRKIEINGMQCLYCPAQSSGKIIYILYPMDALAQWIEPAARHFGADIVVITGMDWESVFSPWPAKGVPAGSEDFRGQSPAFLQLLQDTVIPRIESALGYGTEAPERTLTGVSMSGLFALWQWIECDTFANIASLSGSFWYEGFVDWLKSRPLPAKTGKAYFLLGRQESHSPVKAFNTVGADTQEIVTLLHDAGIRVRYDIVPGNHYANPIPRLNHALTEITSN